MASLSILAVPERLYLSSHGDFTGCAIGSAAGVRRP
jgi:hypothetical protein